MQRTWSSLSASACVDPLPGYGRRMNKLRRRRGRRLVREQLLHNGRDQVWIELARIAHHKAVLSQLYESRHNSRRPFWDGARKRWDARRVENSPMQVGDDWEEDDCCCTELLRVGACQPRPERCETCGCCRLKCRARGAA